MEQQQQRIAEYNTPRTQSAIENTGAHYSAKELAHEFGTSSSNLRTRWFDWLKKVAPEQLLKTESGYTELARALFSEFQDVDSKERQAWVVDAKHRYSHEWEPAGVIEGELVPDEVGSVLALRQEQNTQIAISVAQQMNAIEALIDQSNTAEANLSEAEIKAACSRGQQRAVSLYQVELQAELQTTNLLRQRRMEGKQ